LFNYFKLSLVHYVASHDDSSNNFITNRIEQLELPYRVISNLSRY